MKTLPFWFTLTTLVALAPMSGFSATDTFSEQQQLTGSDGAPFDQFGGAVAISGDTAIVGAPYDAVGANLHQGSVYVFVRSGGTWIQQAQLFANDGAGGDEFGWSVALDGDTAVIGAEADDVFANTDQGSAYVFVRSGTTWTQQAHLFANDGSARDRDFFGNSVAVQGDTAIVGAFLNDSFNVNQGSAYVFVRSGTSWALQQHLFASDGAITDEFGSSVALDGDTAVVGAWSKTVSGNFQEGAAYVFVRAGTTWSQQSKLEPADGQSQDFFGVSVGLSGDTIIVGSDSHDTNGQTDQGAAYVYLRSGTNWTQQAELTASDGLAGDQFGHSVGLAGDTAVVGAWMNDIASAVDQGSAYVFGRAGTVWTEQQQLTATSSAAGSQSGNSVALDGNTNTLIVGAWADDVGANIDQGSATVFTQPAATVHVASVTPRFKPQGSANRIQAKIRIVDANRTPVNLATVSVDVTLPNGRHGALQGVTDSNGNTQVSQKSPLSGTFTFCVSDVVVSGFTYDAAQNVETCDSVIVP